MWSRPTSGPGQLGNRQTKRRDPARQPGDAVDATEDTLIVGCARTLSPGQGWLHTIDLPTRRIASTVELPSQPRAIAVDGRTAWVACGRGPVREGTIERVDLEDDRVTQWRETNWAISDLALLEDILLASMSLELAVPVASGEFVGGGGGGHGGHGGGHGGGH